ncbi:MAG: hypothetical protein J0I36_02940, partial [Pandoraea sp.]|nr:hypothetical protein [Pandoraea sp.]
RPHVAANRQTDERRGHDRPCFLLGTHDRWQPTISRRSVARPEVILRMVRVRLGWSIVPATLIGLPVGGNVGA